MAQDDFDLPLRLDIHLQVILGARLRMAALDVLADHDERHEKYLDHVGQEQPERERHRRGATQSCGPPDSPAPPKSPPPPPHQKTTPPAPRLPGPPPATS